MFKRWTPFLQKEKPSKSWQGPNLRVSLKNCGGEHLSGKRETAEGTYLRLTGGMGPNRFLWVEDECGASLYCKRGGGVGEEKLGKSSCDSDRGCGDQRKKKINLGRGCGEAKFEDGGPTRDRGAANSCWRQSDRAGRTSNTIY